jgi:hypothetical protein
VIPENRIDFLHHPKRYSHHHEVVVLAGIPHRSIAPKDTFNSANHRLGDPASLEKSVHSTIAREVDLEVFT